MQLIVGRKTKINAAETLHGEWILTTMGRLRRGNFRHCNWGQVKILLSVPSQPSQQHKFCVITQMSPSYFLTIKIIISSILLAQLVLMHDRYKSPNFFYSKYSIICVINQNDFFGQQHYFDSTIADVSFTICPSPQMQLEGDAGKILH